LVGNKWFLAGLPMRGDDCFRCGESVKRDRHCRWS
jgi:hypothetical protein